MRTYEIRSDGGIDALALAERPDPAPGPGQVVVRIHASSLNYRDLNTVRYPGRMGLQYPRIPNSDGAGEVLAVGPGVTGLAPGDRVASCFFQRWEAGSITGPIMASALGGALDGVLTEQAVLRADGVIPVPDGYSWEEAATLPCAALTAWHALVVKGALKAGDTVLLLGTGGVSIFALQFAVMHGARVIVTSKSDEKLARAREMGAWQTVNYVETPDWASAVKELTGGIGVDHVVEVGGAGTLQQSLEAVRIGGHVALIGVLSGGEINPVPIMRKSIRLNGVYVGSRAMFRDMNAAIVANGLKPVIDRSFAFDEAREAFHAMAEAGHFGKIVVRVAP